MGPSLSGQLTDARNIRGNPGMGAAVTGYSQYNCELWTTSLPVPLIILLIGASSASLVAQPVITTPVGVMRLTVAANTTKALSLPLDNVPLFVGLVASRTSTTIATTNANFTRLFREFSG